MKMSGNIINKRSVYSFIAIIVFLFSGCNDIILDDWNAENKTLDTEFLENNTLSSLCIQSLGTELTTNKLSYKQTACILASVKKHIIQNQLTNSQDIAVIAPKVITAALMAISESEAIVTDIAGRKMAISAIVSSATKSLKGNIDLSTLSASISYYASQTDSIQRVDLNTLSDTTNIFERIASTSVSYLDEAGVPTNQIPSTLELVTHDIVKHLVEIGIGEEHLAAVVKSISTGTIGAADEAGLLVSDVVTTMNKTFNGIFTGLDDSGLSTNIIKNLADDVCEGAILGLPKMGITGSAFESAITESVTLVKSSLLEAGVQQAEIDAIESTISQSLLEAKSAIVDDPTSDQINRTVPSHNTNEISRTEAISIIFNQDMDDSTINTSSFTVNNGIYDITGDINYNSVTKTVTFTPDSHLSSSTNYEVTALSAIKNTEGVTLSKDYKFIFKTRSDNVSAGKNHSCLRTNSGKVFCWGDGAYGGRGSENVLDLGDESSDMENLEPVNIGNGKTILQLSSGYAYNCAILNDGSLKCWGRNNRGQLGLGDLEHRGDEPGEMGDNLLALDLGEGRTVKSVSCGDYHACAILDNGQVKCWGYNKYGQLGLGDTDNRGDSSSEMGRYLPNVDLGIGRTAKKISAGYNHTCVLLDNNTIKCWGRNNYGELGQKDDLTRGDEANEMGENLIPIDFGTGRIPISVEAGNYYTCAVFSDGKLSCWGYNSNGQLGLEHSIEYIGDSASEMGNNTPIVNIGIGRSVVGITTSGSHTCARLDNYKIKCWGSYRVGRLGFFSDQNIGDDSDEMGENLPYVDLGIGRTVLEIASGGSHNCARLDNDSLKCWGFNFAGQLGLNDDENRSDDEGEMGDRLPPVIVAFD